MSVEQVSDLDLSYTPPLSSPCDPVQWRRKRGHRLCGHRSDGPKRRSSVFRYQVCPDGLSSAGPARPARSPRGSNRLPDSSR
jgi:hypothetical protein